MQSLIYYFHWLNFPPDFSIFVSFPYLFPLPSYSNTLKLNLFLKQRDTHWLTRKDLVAITCSYTGMVSHPVISCRTLSGWGKQERKWRSNKGDNRELRYRSTSEDPKDDSTGRLLRLNLPRLWLTLSFPAAQSLYWVTAWFTRFGNIVWKPLLMSLWQSQSASCDLNKTFFQTQTGLDFSTH